MKNNLIMDKNFLKLLDQHPNKITYVKITALDLQENPLQSIEGYVTQGTINVDGASSIRRTCSLTLVTNYQNFDNPEDFKIFFEYTWGLNTRFFLEIGIENKVDSNYPEIIWFPQGIYLITSISSTYNTNSFQISISGKDKMCLLNGEVSGVLGASTDFGTEDNMGEIVKLPLETIIRNIVHVYGKEPYHNITIRDLEYGLELLEYRGNGPLYLLKSGTQLETEVLFDNFTTDGDTACFIIDNADQFDSTKQYRLSDIETECQGQYDFTGKHLLPIFNNPTIIQLANDQQRKNYNIVKLEYGNTAGFRNTQLTYAGDLIANAGESLTSVLDKIIKMLGEYEYFYDEVGSFIFQRKRNSLNDIIGQGLNEHFKNKYNINDFVNTYVNSTDIYYTFDSANLITNISHSPNINNIKNDYVIWGERQSISGANIPIHLRMAIDEKPIKYTSIFVEEDNVELKKYNQKYDTKITGQKSITYIAHSTYEYSNTTIKCDWREIIYQMAQDYYRYGHLNDFLKRVKNANKNYPTGITGYEQYYIDLQGFWRDLYYPQEIFNAEIDECEQEKKQLETMIYKTDDEKTRLQELINKITLLEEKKENYYFANNAFTVNLIAWNKNIIQAPELLNFWFDFIDTTLKNDLAKYSVKSIGCRQKVLSDTSLKAIYYLQTPSIIYSTNLNRVEEDFVSVDYSYLQVPKDNEMFTISSQGVSLYDKLMTLLNQHTTQTETLTLNTVPIYYLQPNVNIEIKNNDLGIEGKYIITKLTIPLTYNGTMQISAKKTYLDFF